MDDPQVIWPGVVCVPVAMGLLGWFAPRIWRWWMRTRLGGGGAVPSGNNGGNHHPDHSPPNTPTQVYEDGPSTSVFPIPVGTHIPYTRTSRDDGSPSPPSSPLTDPTRGTGSLTVYHHPRRLSLRSAALQPRSLNP